MVFEENRKIPSEEDINLDPEAQRWETKMASAEVDTVPEVVRNIAEDQEAQSSDKILKQQMEEVRQAVDALGFGKNLTQAFGEAPIIADRTKIDEQRIRFLLKEMIAGQEVERGEQPHPNANRGRKAA